MQPRKIHHLAKTFILGVSLISCQKEIEQLEDNQITTSKTENILSKNTDININTLNSIFNNKNYDKILSNNIKSTGSNSWLWIPLWDKAYQIQVSDTLDYFYVPLQAMQENNLSKIKLIGGYKYILIRVANGEPVFNIATYFSENTKIDYSSINDNVYLPDNFSGKLELINLDTNDNSHFLYKDGKVINNPLKIKTNQHKNNSIANSSISCVSYYTCYWTGNCQRSDNAGYQPYVWGLITNGVDYCAAPSIEKPSDCLEFRWEKTDQSISVQCGDPTGPTPPDPGTPTPPPGGGGTPTVTLVQQLSGNKTSFYGPCPGLTDAWKPLLNYTPSTSTIQRLSYLTANEQQAIGMLTPSAPSMPSLWQIQSIQQAEGIAVNLDYFSVNISQLPNGFNSPQQFLEHIRQNINTFVDPNISSFTPFPLLTGEADRWIHNPLSTIVSIDIPIDRGSVIVSDYAPDHWTFSTIHDPFNGDHPVSGNRTFGYTVTPNGYTFYTRGADRINGILPQLIGQALNFPSDPLQFAQADALWSSYSREISKYVNKHGGSATENNAITNRPDWQSVKIAINNNLPLSSVPCN